MAAARSLFRITTSPLSRTAFRPTTLRQQILRQVRKQNTAAAAEAPADGPSKFAQFWNSKVGPKTVHFWAPVMKWALALVGVSDFARPAESLSLSQNSALMATGLIWTRWCFIIKPQNLFLAAVNFFLFCVGTTQVTRILLYNQSLKKDGVADELKDAAKSAKDTAEGIVKDPVGAVKKAENV